MSNTALHFFESIRNAAETFAEPRIQSQLLAELAQNQMSAGQFDAALQTFTAIPLPQERRVALLTADFQFFPQEKVESLLQLLKSDPRTKFLAGSLALAMVETNNVRPAWKLIETAEETFLFESEQQRYDFLEKALPQINEADWEKVIRFHQTFTDGTHRDWATLAIIKYLVRQQREDEAERFINALSTPLRRSWAYWELCRLSSAERSANFFDKAIKIIETATISSEEEEEMERLAIQLRILGRAAFQRGDKEKGERLLERSESAIECLAMPMQRYRLRCFLGKVLLELQRIGSIQEYLPMDSMLESLPSGSDRSRVLVWLAESGWNEGWTKAIEAIVAPERGVPESDRAEQIAGVLKRFVAHDRGFEASGNPSEDSVRISGEEFETLYFNPFAEVDCGC